MNIRALLTLPLFIMTLFHLPATAEEDLAIKMAGIINSGSGGQRLLSTGDMTRVTIDARYLVKGDRLNIFEKIKGARNISQTGSLLVVTPSAEPVKGVIVTSTQEIGQKAYVDFALSDERQNDLFLPFLQSMADTFYKEPRKGLLPVAVIDVTTSSGKRTEAGDIIAKKLIKAVCERGQFACPDRSVLAQRFWQAGVNTSNDLDELEVKNVLSPLDVQVYVTGHLKPSRGGVDLILMAHAVNQKTTPKKVWRRFFFPIERLGITKKMLETVTMSNAIQKKGRLKVSIGKVKTIEGQKVEYVVYKDLSTDSLEDDVVAQTFGAGKFFVSIDGRPILLQMGGLFFDGAFPIGKHSIEAGFYPESRFSDDSSSFSKTPVFKQFEIELTEGGKTDIILMGGVEKNVAILAIDLD